MKAIITVDVPEFQIGQEVSVYFKDTMCVKGVCTPLTESDKMLDKIKAEIEHIGGDDEKAFCKNLNDSYKQGLKDALKVIDKYRKGDKK